MLITTNVRGRFSYDAGKSRLLPAETMPVRGKKALMSIYFFVAKNQHHSSLFGFPDLEQPGLETLEAK